MSPRRAYCVRVIAPSWLTLPARSLCQNGQNSQNAARGPSFGRFGTRALVSLDPAARGRVSMSLAAGPPRTAAFELRLCENGALARERSRIFLITRSRKDERRGPPPELRIREMINLRVPWHSTLAYSLELERTLARRPECAYSVEKLSSPTVGCELRQTGQFRPERNQ